LIDSLAQTLTILAVVAFICIVLLTWKKSVPEPDYESQIVALVSEATAARERDGNLELRTAALEKEVQELKAVNLALQPQMQPRRLSADNSAKLTCALTALQPMPLAVVSRSYDAEGAELADDLAAAFTSAKWQADRQKDWLMSNKGLALATLEGTTIPPSLAIALVEALRSVNLQATVTIVPESERESISVHFQPKILYLLVGAKP
jgi:hypothetical protein